MVDKRDTDRLEALRQRLYSRGENINQHSPVDLTKNNIEVKNNWDISPRGSRNSDTEEIKDNHSSISSTINEPMTLDVSDSESFMPRHSNRNKYRLRVLLVGLFFFVVSVALSSLFILFGGRSISAENIAISITGPFTVGGGEVLPLQVGISNQNNIPIESATLVVQYPLGTQSDGENPTELFTERLPLNVIESGEAVNVPLRVRVFGEENQDLNIKASVEYRVKGSNATFYKEAEPLVFKISSSPLVVSIDAPRSVSSGQVNNLRLKVRSNSPTTLRDILVRAEYPKNFIFDKSNPNPVSGRNVWLIESLEPEQELTINISGEVRGASEEKSVVNFSLGIPNEKDRYSLASIYTLASHEFTLEEAFLDVNVLVNGSKSSTGTVSPGRSSNLEVEITNTLSEAIYDAVVELTLSGNALTDTEVQAGRGFYDSNTKKLVWDISSVPDLERILPGATISLNFNVRPDINTVLTPQINIDAGVRARRVSERNAEEELVGNVKSVVKVDTAMLLASEVGYNSGVIADTGPVPPVVGKNTTYTISMVVENGSNEVSSGVLTTTLPTYVTWTGETSGVGNFNYNPVSRTLTWEVGSMKANAVAFGAFQVSFLPSASQIGKTPTILTEQVFKAKDNFTGSDLRENRPALTSELPDEAGYSNNSGVVQPSE